MAKPVITDKPIIDQAEFNGVTIWRKEGGSIEVSDTNYPSMKAAIQDIAAKAGVALQDDWNTQYAGWYLIQQLNKNAAPCNSLEQKNGYAIYYCSPEKISLNNPFDVEILSHEFESGKGLIILASAPTIINDRAFINSSISYIDISDSIKKIGDEAFDNTKITNLIIPPRCNSFGIVHYWPELEEITYLGEPHTFSVAYKGATIKRFNGPFVSADGRCIVDKDGNLLGFAGKGIRSYTMPSNVIRICCNAFCDCSELEHVVIPQSVRILEGGAFSGCSSLKKVCIEGSPSFIYGNPFSFCDSLEEFSGPQASSDGRLLQCSSNNEVLVSFAGSGIDCYTIPQSVKIIGEDAFAGNCSLMSLLLPNSISSIREDAFFKCSKLLSLVLPDSLTPDSQLEDNDSSTIDAFYGCEKLKYLSLPNNGLEVKLHNSLSVKIITR